MVNSSKIADEILGHGLIGDPWVGGRLRFNANPIVLTAGRLGSLAGCAVSMCRVLDAYVNVLVKRPDVMASLGIPASLQAIASIDAPRWLTFARVDVFETNTGSGPIACEINCDTPTGLAETIESSRLGSARHPQLRHPSLLLEPRWKSAVNEALGKDPRGATVGLIEPTEMTEDTNHTRLLMRWLGEMGCQVVRGSPFNIESHSDRGVGMFGKKCDLLLRHYKTDWWGVREAIWLDEPDPPDASPLGREFLAIADALGAGKVNVINPFAAAIPQNKRVMALPWEMPGLISAELEGVARATFPETHFAENVPAGVLLDEQMDWVLKSDYGCEGEEVILGSATTPEVWAESIIQMRPRRWVAQRAFVPQRDSNGDICNLGVWMVGSAPSGVLARTSEGATDGLAQICPVGVEP